MSLPLQQAIKLPDDITMPSPRGEHEDLSPGAKVGSTAELVEMILRHIKWKKMFGVKRVSTLWNDTIVRLLREPEYRILSTIPAETTQVYKRTPGTRRGLPSTTALVQVQPGEPWHGGCRVVQYHHLLEDPTFRGFDSSAFVDGNTLLKWSSGIWEDMFLTQPPCEKVTIASWVQGYTTTISAIGGVTWRDMVEEFHHRRYYVSTTLPLRELCRVNITMNTIGKDCKEIKEAIQGV